MSFKHILFIIIAIIIIILLTAFQCKIETFQDSDKDSKSSTHEVFSQMTKHKRNIWFHDPYTYNYVSTKYEGRSNLKNELLLSFLSFKFKGVTKEEWNDKGYNDPMKLLQEKLLCKTTIHDLKSIEPTSINEMRKHIKNSLNQMEKEGYKDLITNESKNSNNKIIKSHSILAPVYVILLQYPNRFYKNNHGDKAYKYTEFDTLTENIKPYERQNRSTGNISFSCIGSDCETNVDTKMMIVYPMYDKNKVAFYPPVCSEYFLNKLPENMNLFMKIKENERNNQPKPNIKGIVDMIKILNEEPFSIEKHQSTFIQCNKNHKLFCGCGTRFEGVEDPDKMKSNEKYKSFCKEPKSDNKFTHFPVMYRLNELEIEDITDINMDPDTENKIDFLLVNDGCKDS
tara:strand:- start:1384 stop:2577 length:1194 start_codon:yes stop_codon:yes gene_type:complete